MKLTYQFRIDQFLSNEQYNQIAKLMSVTAKFYRYCVNVFSFPEQAMKKFNVVEEKELFLALKKKDFCGKYNINTQYANSISREAKDKVKLFKEHNKDLMKQYEFRIFDLSKQNEKLIKELNNKNYKQRKEIRQIIYDNNRLIEQLNKKHHKAEKATINCGEKHLQKTNLEKWQKIREDGNFVISLHEPYNVFGSHHFKFKQLAKNTNKFNLNLEVCNGEKINIPIEIKLSKKDRQNKICDILNNPLDYKSSFRLVKKNNKLFVQISVDITLSKENVKSDVFAGVDFNNGHIDFCIVKENNLQFQTIDFKHKDATSNQRKESLLLAIKQMFKILKENKVDVLKMENLNFSKLKTKKNQIKAMNRMIHSLPYSRYSKLMEIEAFKNNITLIAVNPAYTSQNGKKLMEQEKDKFKNNTIHQIAAYMIALKKN